MYKTKSKGVTEIPATPFAFIWFAIKPFKKLFILAIVCLFFADLLIVLQSYIFKGFVDSANSYAQGGATTLRTVFLWVATYPVLILVSWGFIRATGFIMIYLKIYARMYAAKELFRYLTQHSLSYFNDRFSGSLSERVNTVSQNVSRILNEFIWSILSLFVTFVTTSVVIYTTNKVLSYVFVIGFLLLIPFNAYLSRTQIPLAAIMVELWAKLRGQIIDTVTNMTAVQQFSRRFFEMNNLDNSISGYQEAFIKGNTYRERVLLINNIIVGVFIGVIVFWSFSLWSMTVITVGSFVMIISLTRGFMRDLTHVGQNLNNIMEFYGEMQNGLSEIVRPHEIVDREGAKKLSVEKARVEFNNVTFAYSGDPRKIFDNLSFTVEHGQKVGIVGTSGAGKTTLMKLLLRQYDLVAGGISIDSQDIREVTQESLRQNISIVPQEPMLFHRTIRENIMYGKLDATEEEMIEVAKKAQAHDFIEALPDKYDSLVGERGVKLSVGQRQRIAIARAFLKNAPILILDEATSALDSESEVAVQKALQLLMEGKTVFAIAHRLSTLRDMDRILVFKDGQIVEDGSHRSLLKNKEGAYASFWGHQAGGFIKED